QVGNPQRVDDVGRGQLDDHRIAERHDDVVEGHGVVGGGEGAVGPGVANVPRPLLAADLDADGAGIGEGAIDVEEGAEIDRRSIEQVAVDDEEDGGGDGQRQGDA